jgi:hypothetical protein
MTMSKEFIQLGAVMKGKDGGVYIKVDDKIKLNVNGKIFEGKYISLQKPELKFERMLDKGSITESEFEEKVNRIPDFVKYELVAVFDK